MQASTDVVEVAEAGGAVGEGVMEAAEQIERDVRRALEQQFGGGQPAPHAQAP